LGLAASAADKLAKVLDDRLRNLKIQVTNTGDTLITATHKNAHSTSAGSQGHP
jgi:hypothetical protein